MDLIQQIHQIDLRAFLESEGHKFRDNMTLCPFHDDKKPSLSITNKNGVWLWHCFGCNKGGSIIDFIMERDGLSKAEAIKKLKKDFGINDEKPRPKIVARYSYTDEAGKELFKILRYHPKDFRADRKMNGIRRVLYRLPDVIKADEIWLVEGEKDVNNVRKLGLVATTAPFGLSHWRPEFAETFKGKKVRICLDIGTGKEAEQRAECILKAGASEVKIVRLPGLEKQGQDISDWIEMQDSKIESELKEWFEAIAAETPAYGMEGLEAETVEDILLQDIPPIEWQIKSLVERRGFTLLGAIKGVGKSLFVTSLGLHYAAGRSPFIHPDFIIEKPGKVLYVQQEVSLSGMKDRFFKMQAEKCFDLQGRFKQKTTTGNPWNLNKKDDRQKLEKLVELHSPDVLILDPFYTFCVDTNNLKAVGEVVSFLLQLKTKFNVGLLIVHHFSNKPKEDVFISTVGRFMGSSTIANAADTTIAMEFLNSRYKHQPLNYPYNHYATIEVTARHGEWPQKFAVERKGDSLIFSLSDIWNEMGKKILPETIEQLLMENDGEMFQKDLIEVLAEKASQTTIFNVIRDLENDNRIERFNIKFEGKSMKKIRLN